MNLVKKIIGILSYLLKIHVIVYLTNIKHFSRIKELELMNWSK